MLGSLAVRLLMGVFRRCFWWFRFVHFAYELMPLLFGSFLEFVVGAWVGRSRHLSIVKYQEKGVIWSRMRHW